MSLIIIPMTFRQACAWVGKYHRHNKPPVGCKFAIGAADNEGVIHGVAMAGRPIARHNDDGFTIEVNRTVTDGTPNVNSFLYAACWRIAREMGYLRAVTMTQGEEPGTSLRAAGWKVYASRPARMSWQGSTGSTGDKDLFGNDCSPMRMKRDPIGNGGVPRTVWEIR